jgi:hypothetical protein
MLLVVDHLIAMGHSFFSLAATSSAPVLRIFARPHSTAAIAIEPRGTASAATCVAYGPATLRSGNKWREHVFGGIEGSLCHAPLIHAPRSMIPYLYPCRKWTLECSADCWLRSFTRGGGEAGRQLFIRGEQPFAAPPAPGVKPMQVGVHTDC